jgi:ABC-2 type transport system ATP-binding protein
MEQVEQMCDDICLINHGTQVLSGGLKEVKRRFGKNTVVLDYEGPDSFLGDDLVKHLNRFPNYSEILLNDGADSQEVLKRALEVGARVNRFELVEPSLNDIFIETVTGSKKVAQTAEATR